MGFWEPKLDTSSTNWIEQQLLSSFLLSYVSRRTCSLTLATFGTFNWSYKWLGGGWMDGSSPITVVVMVVLINREQNADSTHIHKIQQEDNTMWNALIFMMMMIIVMVIVRPLLDAKFSTHSPCIPLNHPEYISQSRIVIVILIIRIIALRNNRCCCTRAQHLCTLQKFVRHFQWNFTVIVTVFGEARIC